GSGGSGGSSGSGSGDDAGGGATPQWADMNIDCDVSLTDTVWDEGTCQAETRLECGDSVLATNANGPSQLDGGAYASFWACAVVGPDSYTGNEQHFYFEHPGTGYVRIGLDSPCEDLDLFVVRWDGGSCLHPELSIVECEGQVSSGGGWLYIWNNTPSGYVVIVDGPNGENGPYGVTLNCEDYDPFAR
ncbi:MAG TPA: hypothetical protein DFR83_16335, partial [Deltaproteobacteria bacterium]|nr:hypothetical protein [Deltaproteobacteria bacterium]